MLGRFERGRKLTEQDDPDCLVCAEPLDLSDLNFKPCQCGIQVSYFDPSQPASP